MLIWEVWKLLYLCSVWNSESCIKCRCFSFFVSVICVFKRELGYLEPDGEFIGRAPDSYQPFLLLLLKIKNEKIGDICHIFPVFWEFFPQIFRKIPKYFSHILTWILFWGFFFMAMFHVLNRFQKAYLHFFMLNPSFGMSAMYATSKNWKTNTGSYVLSEKGKMLKNKQRHLLQAVIQISICFFFPWLPVFPPKMYLIIIHHPRWIGQWADNRKKEKQQCFCIANKDPFLI
jgi:hypothetical protein